MLKKLIKLVSKRGKSIDDICSQFDSLQDKVLENIKNN